MERDCRPHCSLDVHKNDAQFHSICNSVKHGERSSMPNGREDDAMSSVTSFHFHWDLAAWVETWATPDEITFDIE